MRCVSRYEYRFRGTRVYIAMFPHRMFFRPSRIILPALFSQTMRFIIVLSVAVGFITRVCLAVPYPAAPPHQPIRPVNGFWDCVKCETECAAVVAGCSAVCAIVEWTGPLCAVRHIVIRYSQSHRRLGQRSELSEYAS